jgi:hypothetical protein
VSSSSNQNYIRIRVYKFEAMTQNYHDQRNFTSDFFYFKFAIRLLSCYMIDFNCASSIFICSLPIIDWYVSVLNQVLLENQSINSLRVKQEAFEP